MPRQNSSQRKTVGRVMHEWKHGELESSQGRQVKSKRQAVAIALSEAGSSKDQSPSEKRRQLTRTKAKERRGDTAQQTKEGRPAKRSSTARGAGRTRAQLYKQAMRKKIPGRSSMTKAQLERALSR